MRTSRYIILIRFFCIILFLGLFCYCASSDEPQQERLPEDIHITSITLDYNERTLQIGETFTLNATVKPDNVTNPVLSWKTYSPNIVTVTKGIVTAISPGTAKIAVSSTDGSNITTECEITVIKSTWPYSKLISLWNHQVNLDITNIVEELDVNLVWTHDLPYSGQSWEKSHMYNSLQVPGINYVFGKINRVAWGWTHKESVEHARWVATLSKKHPEIIGLYLNDFYDEIEEGYRTEEQWREIISAAREVNPKLHLWVPHYPHREQNQHDFDFDIDGVVVNIWGNKPEQIASIEEHITNGLEHHPDKYMVAGLYLHSGNDEGRWLTEHEFKKILGYYVDLMNENKLVGIRIFSAGQFDERPEYLTWAKEVLKRFVKNQE